MEKIVKKLLLLATITMAGYNHAQEIPTLAQLRPQFELKKKDLVQRYPDGAEKLNDSSFLLDSIYNIPANVIKKALEQWHQEQPEIFNNTVLISGQLVGDIPVSFVDVFAVARRQRDHLLNNKLPVEFVDRSMTLDHLNTIIDTLKQFGIKQTLSDEQIDSFAQLEANETQKAYKEITGQGPGMETFFEELYHITD